MDNDRADIVIVDDNADNLRFLSIILKQTGYHVRPANSGEKALDVIDAKVPELILLDIMMPGIDGFQVCEHLKANNCTKEIPVIFISALDNVQEKVRAFALGCVDYITKPFQEEEILARISTHVRMEKLKKELILRNAMLEQESEKNRELIKKLGKTIENVKELSGLLPICAKCKKIRDDKGYWGEIEKYIETHTKALFSHGLCPDCLDDLYGDEKWFQKSRS